MGRYEPEVMRVEPVDTRIDVISDVVYRQVIGQRSVRQLHMTLLVPGVPGPKPVVMYFPGGGFLTCQYDSHIEMRMALAKAGFVVAAVEYRTIPDRYPSLVEDAQAAVDYIADNAERFGIDSGRIGVLGDSAGGYVAQMLGVTCPRVKAVVSMYGISDLTSIGEGKPAGIKEIHHSPAANEALMLFGTAYKTYRGSTVVESADKALAASPISRVDGDVPPFLLMHGTADTLVPVTQSEKMFRKLRDNGADAELVLIEGADHGDIYWYQKSLIDRVVIWFVKKGL